MLITGLVNLTAQMKAHFYLRKEYGIEEQAAAFIRTTGQSKEQDRISRHAHRLSGHSFSTITGEVASTMAFFRGGRLY